jgi:hypothetical protein
MSCGVEWLLIIHNLPPKPQYLRAKTLRRLTQLGALPLKRSAYLLPRTESALEDLQWLSHEVRADGGDAWVLEAGFVAGLTNEEIRERFRTMRRADYQSQAADARALLDRINAGIEADGGAIQTERRKLARRLETSRQLDFFDADGRDEVEVLMATIDRRSATGADVHPTLPRREELTARRWATRAGVKVDRMASAWLIRRFIDPAATFVFLAADGSAPPPGALRFDTFEGEFTHDGNRCTFEVLLDVAARKDDRGLAAIAQIVHDLDLRDDQYQRPETAGVGAVIAGVAAGFDDDHRRIAESGPFFDALYTSLGGRDARASSQQK